jgi:hypothetical protein
VVNGMTNGASEDGQTIGGHGLNGHAREGYGRPRQSIATQLTAKSQEIRNQT